MGSEMCIRDSKDTAGSKSTCSSPTPDIKLIARGLLADELSRRKLAVARRTLLMWRITFAGQDPFERISRRSASPVRIIFLMIGLKQWTWVAACEVEPIHQV